MPTQVNLTGNQEIDALFWGYKWDITNFTVRFPVDAFEYAPSAANGFQGYNNVLGFQPFSVTQQNDIFLTLNNLSTFSNLTFSIEQNYGFGHLRFGQATQVDSGNVQGLHVPGQGSAEGNPPDPTLMPPHAQGDTWYNIGHYTTPILGNFERAAGMMHEIGHAIGLKHGHVTQMSHGQNFPALPAGHDSQNYSIMTYNAYEGTLPTGGQEYPWTYMQNDIAAIQHMYGANYSANAGDNTYTFDSTTGEMSIDGFGFGASYNSKIFLTIWDGDGNDTYDFSNYTSGATVNLNPGQWTTHSTSQLVDLGNDGVHFADGNIANALLFNNDTRSMIENAITGSGNDILTGNLLANVLTANGGNDFLYGKSGDDTLYGGSGNDTLRGHAGIDKLRGQNGVDKLHGGDDNDDLRGGSGNDILWGDGGNDFMLGENGLDFMYGSDGNDNMSGGGQNDVLKGNNGNDILNGNDGDDKLYGNAGNDILRGGNGNDILSAFEGDDQLFGDAGDDFLFGGRDTDVLYGGTGIDRLRGNLGNDILNGNQHDDTLFGGGSNDRLNGGSGNDFLLGENGNDVLQGNTGDDKAFGGNGVDRFIFDAGDDILRIRDWNVNGFQDVIDLTDFNFASKAAALATASQAGANVKFDFGGGDLIYVENTLLVDVAAGDLLI